MTGGRHTLRPFLAREWRALAGAAASTVVLSAADLAKPWPLALVLDELLRGREGRFSLSGADVRLLAAIAALVVAIALADALAQYLADFWLQSAGERITHELRVAVYAHLQRLSLGFHQRRQKGDLVTRVTGDVNAVGDLFADTLGELAQDALLLVGMISVILVLDPPLALAALATMPALAVVSVVYRRRIRAQARRQRAHEGSIASLANEALSAMPVVKAFGSEGFEGERVRRRSEERMAIGVDLARLQARFDGVVGVLGAVGTALVLVVGVTRVAAGALSAGELIVFASYARKAHSPLRGIAREATKVVRALARAERIAEILETEETLEERPGAFHGERARGDLALEGVSFGYEPGRPVLRDVSLTIPAGARVAVIGPSGSGKSTLAALVARFYDPTSGRVAIDGRDARDCALAWLREQVGVLLQDTVLFSATVEENIAYASGAGPEDVRSAARVAAAHEFVSALSRGYATELGPQGVGLSGGQRQRIGIARTLLRDPPILVLDEPTTGLDIESRARVMDGLWALMRGRTTILVTHSLELARSADRVIVVREGRVVRDGRPDELIADEAAFRGLAGEDGAHAAPAGGAPARRTAPAPDPALPQLGRLLDVDAVTPALTRSMARDASLADVAIGRVVYAPGRMASVHYRLTVDGRPHDAVATASAADDLAVLARTRRYVEMARAASGRCPAARALAYDLDLDALVTWLPFDPRLPGLAQPADALAARLRHAGAVVSPEAGEIRLIGYKPRARAVVRLDGLVLKAYGGRAQFEAALAGMRASASQPSLRTARLEGALPDLRVIAQAAIPGTMPPDAARAAPAAGRLARRLRDVSPGELAAAPPEHELAAAARKARVVATVLPALAERLGALLARLRESMPAPAELLTAHGDFHVDQLLEAGSELFLVDFDGMCVASPAVDLATYAADVVRGRDGDSAAVAAVVEPLMEGYGRRPAAFDWHLATAILARAAHPFQRQVPGWPERVEGTIDAAEAALG